MHESTEAALLGHTIAGKFLIESFIGGGAMGAVYKARQIALDKVVAIKVMRPERASDTMYAVLFHREAKAASRLDHPSSVRVLDFGQEPDGLLYIAMEYFPGRDLHRVLAEDWPLSAGRIADMLSQALAALAVAHEMGIVHRDLKPENILVQPGVDDEGKPRDLVKVCDFGIAKLIESGDGSVARAEPRVTEGLVIGTPHYMSPEQGRGEGLDLRSDIYSIGIILYQLLAARVPFEGTTAVDVVVMHVRDEPVSPSQWAPGCDPQLEAICLKALQKKREDRYQSAREMRAALRAVLAAPPSQPRAAAKTDTGPWQTNRSSAAPVPVGHAASNLTPAPASLPPPNRNAGLAAVAIVGALLASASVAGVIGLRRFLPRTSPAPGAIPSPSPSVAAPQVSTGRLSIDGATPVLLPPLPVSIPSSPEPAAPVPTAPIASRGPSAAVLPGARTPAVAPEPKSKTDRPDRIEVPKGAESAVAALGTVARGAATPTDPPAPVSSVDLATVPSAGPVALPAATPALPAFDPELARIDWQVAATGGGATAADVRRALGHVSGVWNACYRSALRAGGQAVNGAGVLHLVTDDEGNVVQGGLTGFGLGDVAACIGRASRVRVTGVDTGSAWADVKLTFRAEP